MYCANINKKAIIVDDAIKIDNPFVAAIAAKMPFFLDEQQFGFLGFP